MVLQCCGAGGCTVCPFTQQRSKWYTHSFCEIISLHRESDVSTAQDSRSVSFKQRSDLFTRMIGDIHVVLSQHSSQFWTSLWIPIPPSMKCDIFWCAHSPLTDCSVRSCSTWVQRKYRFSTASVLDTTKFSAVYCQRRYRSSPMTSSGDGISEWLAMLLSRR